MQELKELIIKVKEVAGSCAAGYKVGDTIVVLGPCIDLERSNIVCFWALSSLMPALFALQLGHDPKSLGLSSKSGVCYLRCSDIGKPYTPGGNVMFEVQQR